MRSRRWLGTRALVHEELEAIGWILDEDECFVTRVRSYYISKLVGSSALALDYVGPLTRLRGNGRREGFD